MGHLQLQGDSQLFIRKLALKEKGGAPGGKGGVREHMGEPCAHTNVTKKMIDTLKRESRSQAECGLLPFGILFCSPPRSSSPT